MSIELPKMPALLALKDCPMCGCAATFVKHSAGMPGTQGFDKWDAVACKHCRTTVGACDRRFRCREDAAAAWNRRMHPCTVEVEQIKQEAARLALERCADLCERLVRDDSDAGECADAIRALADLPQKAEGGRR